MSEYYCRPWPSRESCHATLALSRNSEFEMWTREGMQHMARAERADATERVRFSLPQQHTQVSGRRPLLPVMLRL